jgi:hypothetical protein
MFVTAMVLVALADSSGAARATKSKSRATPVDR